MAAFLVLFALASMVLGLAAWVLPARLALLPGDAARAALLAGRTYGAEGWENLASSRERALGWRVTGETLGDQALVAFERAQRGDGAPETLRQAEAWQEEALQRAPADPYGWARLAAIRLTLEGASPQAAEALRHSLAVAPYEPRLTVARLRMALALWDRLDADGRARVPALIRDGWQRDPKAVLEAAKTYQATARVEDALREDAQALTQFRERAARMR